VEDLQWEAVAAGCCSSKMADGAISGAASIWRAKRCVHPYQADEMCPGLSMGRAACLGCPVARPIRMIALRARPIRIKRVLTDRPW
jgi:hypothetical protein